MANGLPLRSEAFIPRDMASPFLPPPSADAALVSLVRQVVATASGAPELALDGRDRGSAAGRARQTSYYLAHVGFGWTLERTAAAFGRQRSTVSHACRQVEDRRDDRSYDEAVGELETVLRRLASVRI